MKRISSFIVVCFVCITLIACGETNCMGNIKSKYWVSEDNTMMFYFLTEVGCGKAEGRYLADEETIDDLVLEWDAKTDVVEVKTAGYEKIFTANTVIDSKSLVCTFEITFQAEGYDFPKEIIFHWKQNVNFECINNIHIWSNEPVKEPSSGKIYYHCTLCGEKKEVEHNDIANVVLEYEKKEKDRIRKLSNAKPEYIYYFNPVEKVTCTYVFEDSNSIYRIIEKYDINNVFAGACINNLDSIKMLMIVFERKQFTEDIYQKICQIKNEESAVKNFSIKMEKPYIKSYMPNIDYYTNDKEAIEYDVEKGLFNLSDKSLIIKSKEEYDAYLDHLLEVAQYEYLKDDINSKRDLYDDLFFEENALVISKEIVRGSGSIRLTLNNIYVANNKLYIVIRTDEPEIGTADMQYVTFAFVLKKSDVIDVVEVITLE